MSKEPVTYLEPKRELSVGQRVAGRLAAGLANDLDRGATSDQHTAALLRLVADAIDNNYEAELVALARAWRREVDGAGRVG